MYALHSKAIIPIEMEAVTDKTCENDDDITDSRMEMYVKKNEYLQRCYLCRCQGKYCEIPAKTEKRIG